jgi:hypothetical protein
MRTKYAVLVLLACVAISSPTVSAQSCPSISNFYWSQGTVVAGTPATLTFNIANSNGANRFQCSNGTPAMNFAVDPYGTLSYSNTWPPTANYPGSTVVCTLTARQSGCADVSQTASLTILATQNISFGGIANQSILSNQVGLGASASSGLAVSFTSNTPGVCSVSGATVYLLAPGTCTITANQAGNSLTAPAPAVTQSFSITAVCPTITTFQYSPNVINAGDPARLTFSIANPSGNGKLVCPGNGTNIDPYTTTSYDGNWPPTAPLAGTVFSCTLTQRQTGCADVSATTSVTIRALQTISFSAPSNRNLGAGPVSLNATASSGLAVAYSSSTPSVCTVSGNSVSLLAAGTCTITANQAGNSLTAPAPAVTRSFSIIAPVPATPPVLIQATTFTANCQDKYCVRLTGFNLAENVYVEVRAGDTQVLGTLMPTIRGKNGEADFVQVTLTDPAMKGAIDSENPKFNVALVNPGQPPAYSVFRQVLRSLTSVAGTVIAYDSRLQAPDDGGELLGWACFIGRGETIPVIIQQGNTTLARVQANALGDASATSSCSPPLQGRYFRFRWPDNLRDGQPRQLFVYADIGPFQNAVPNNILIGNSPVTVTLQPSQPVARTIYRNNGYLRVGQVLTTALSSAFSRLTGISVVQESGVPFTYVLGAGNIIYYLSPSEQFAETTSTLRVNDASGNRVGTVVFEWETRLGAALTRVVSLEEGQTDPPSDGVNMSSSGIDAAGRVAPGLTTALSYSASSTGALEPSRIRITLVTGTTTQLVTSWFNVDANAATFTATPAGLAQLIAAVKAAGSASLFFSFGPSDFSKSYLFEHALVYANGSLQVSVNSAYAGVNFVLRGFNTGYTAIGQLNTSGAFNFNNLPVDTYEVGQVLLAAGRPSIGVGAIKTADGVTALQIVASGFKSAADSTTGSTLSPAEVASISRVIEGGEPPGFRSDSQSPRASAPTAKFSGTPVYAANVQSGARDSLLVSNVSYSVPAGSTRIGIRLDISTTEFPDYTSVQSVYNDVWMYDIQVQGTQQRLAETGQVNQTHANTGAIFVERCLDVSAAAQSAGFLITGQIGAQNVADELRPTTVALSIYYGCGSDLAITDFIAVADAPDGRPILFPRATGRRNQAGQYLSVPRSALLPPGFGIPATILYTPSNATITEVELFLRTLSGDISLGKNYLSQADVSTPGAIRFASLLLNPLTGPFTPVSGKVQIVAKLGGSVDLAPITSQPGPLRLTVEYGGPSSFTPLYLTSESGLFPDSRRYGARDSGGDSWATVSMTNWLLGNSLRFDDISAPNVKQTPSFRSILGHAGHSDGQQIDVRYMDDIGGYTDTLGGANRGLGIRQLADSALIEVSTNATNKPNLAKLVSWINRNRNNINSFASEADTRIIYIGNGHVEALLVAGIFPPSASGPTVQIPGVQPWTTRNPKIHVQDADHLSHWHVSKNRP